MRSDSAPMTSAYAAEHATAAGSSQKMLAAPYFGDSSTAAYAAMP